MPNWSITDYVKHLQRKNRDRSPRQAGDMEPSAGHASDATLPIPPEVTGKVDLCIECWRIRLADSDGISAKALIDWLCQVRDPKDPKWRLLPGDKARDINVKIIQRHCTKGQPEKVIITISQRKEQNALRTGEDIL